MARSKARRAGKDQRLYFAIPIIAVLIIASAFVFAYLLPPPTDVAMSFNVALEIQVAVNSTSSRLVSPPVVGVPGGNAWATHQFDLQGVGGNYPLYTDSPTSSSNPFSVIHVRSRAVLNYTLGDFFNVWGQPLGPIQTLNIRADNVNTFWQNCVGVVGSPPSSPGHWSSEVLVPDKLIVLQYYFAGGTGCL